MNASARLSACVLLVTFATAANAATYNYFDTTFVNPDWVGVKYVDTSTPAASFTAVQFNPGGSAILPGPQTPDYRRITHNYGGPSNGAIIVSHQATNWNYSPLPFEVANFIDYSYDLNFFDGPAGAVGFAPVIFQGGNVYRSALASDNVFGPQTGWQRFGATSVPITSFFQIDPSTGLPLTGTPNPFNAMSFGFISANSANGTATKISGIDDFRITLDTRFVPEPTSLAALSLLGIVSRRRRAE